MIVGVLKEPIWESRVSLLPEGVTTLVKKNIAVSVEAGAGGRAYCNDEDYVKAGAIVESREAVTAAADVILSIHHDELSATLSHKILIGVYQPLYNPVLLPVWARQQITSFSLDMLPRTTRAQAMDVLSSQANIAGYRAVLVAASLLPHYFPMFITAAGSIAPARVLILGAGVAGLQAVATARRLGAIVEVFDTRPAVKEEVMSLGGKFVEVEGAADASRAGGYAVEQDAAFVARQAAAIGASVAKADVIISTAQIPGRPAPVLVTAGMISSMRAGSVIIDLAAATGGNTEVTRNGETVVYAGVRVVGDSALAGGMPYDASKLYGKNVLNFLQLITDAGGGLVLNFGDELVKGCCITHGGAVVHERLQSV